MRNDSKYVGNTIISITITPYFLSSSPNHPLISCRYCSSFSPISHFIPPLSPLIHRICMSVTILSCDFIVDKVSAPKIYEGLTMALYSLLYYTQISLPLISCIGGREDCTVPTSLHNKIRNDSISFYTILIPSRTHFVTSPKPLFTDSHLFTFTEGQT